MFVDLDERYDVDDGSNDLASNYDADEDNIDKRTTFNSGNIELAKIYFHADQRLFFVFMHSHHLENQIVEVVYEMQALNS